MPSEKKTLRKFQALFAEAIELSQGVRNVNREAADKFLEAALAAPSPWTKHRYIAFTYFRDYLLDHATKSGIKIIERHFLHNKDEPALYRAGAAALILTLEDATGKRNVHDAAEYCRLALDFIKDSPLEDDARVVFHPPFEMREEGSGSINRTVRTELTRLKHVIQATLNILEGRTTTNDVELTAKQQELQTRNCAGGNHCDGCNKSKENLQMDELLKCSRCRMVFYCSSKCQHSAWYAHHKKECRKEGQIKVGDDMVLDRDNVSVLHYMKVIGPGVTNGEWIIKLYGSGEQISASADELIRLRPPSTVRSKEED